MANNTKSIKLTGENFQSEVLESRELVLVDFWAPWCGPCRLIGPTIETLAARFAGKAKIGKLSVDDFGHIAKQYEIQALPTLVFFKNGEVVERVTGVVTEQELSEKIKALLVESQSEKQLVA